MKYIKGLSENNYSPPYAEITFPDLICIEYRNLIFRQHLGLN